MSHPIRITDKAYEAILELKEKLGFPVQHIASILILYGYSDMVEYLGKH